MFKNKNYIIIFLGGAITTLLLFLLFEKITSKNDNLDSYFVISKQIKKMNKLVVVEQYNSSWQKTKMSSQIVGEFLPKYDKTLITETKTTAQISYNLNKMKLDIDSIGKKLIIRELPNAEIKITPSVEITSINESAFNKIDEDDIKKVTKSAKDNAVRTFNQNLLRSLGREQLLKNLNQIFVLAKALNYKIEDQTGTLDTSKL
ncbi:MAG: DUF4230 domain-containing protein [Chryseobacterium sp.]|nr:DUF4230 domain-containing protein [Chryseobacterium sp.]